MTRSSALPIALVAALVGCRDGRSSTRSDDVQARPKAPPPAPPPEPVEAEPSGPAPKAAAVAPSPGDHGKKSCRDWSKLDPSTLPPLPETPFTAAFEQVWEKVLRKHYDPTISCLDWPALRLEYGRRLESAGAWKEAYPIMREMLDRLGQSHFSLVLPGERPPGERIARGRGRPRVEARLIGDEVVVTKTRSTGPLGGLLPGAVIEAIEGEPVQTVVDEIRARWSRPSKVAFEVARAMDAMLSCNPSYKWRIRATDPSQAGKRVIRPLDCRLPKGERVTLGNLRDVPTHVEWRVVEDTKIGYLSFNVWMLPMVKQVTAGLEELRAKGIQSLILDLRGNPGGVGLMAVPVARLFLPEGGSLGKMKFRDFEQDFAVHADPNPFAGPVVVLIDERTASTSEIFVTGMRDLGRIHVVGGRPSVGAALPSMIEELDRGVMLQYVVGDYTSPNGTVVEGKGVVPDTTVEETRDAFAAGRDPVLDAAIAHLQPPSDSDPQGAK